jgi:hypothetical protein
LAISPAEKEHLRVTTGQLAILPVPDGRQAERRIVNLAARLRDPGATLSDIEVVNLSTTGFMAQGDIQLDPGSHAWLKLPGMEPRNSKLVWLKDGKAGFEFVTPMHPGTLELLVVNDRQPGKPKKLFGVEALSRPKKTFGAG